MDREALEARYAGKPFLKLVDSYVLRAIGALRLNEEALLEKMEPKLRQVYGARGRWHEIVAAQMEFSPMLPAKIRTIWKAGSARAVEMGFEPDPVEFTHQFVDTNFLQD